MPVGGFNTIGRPANAAHPGTVTYVVRSDTSDWTQRVREIGAALLPGALAR